MKDSLIPGRCIGLIKRRERKVKSTSREFAFWIEPQDMSGQAKCNFGTLLYVILALWAKCHFGTLFNNSLLRFKNLSYLIFVSNKVGAVKSHISDPYLTFQYIHQP